MVDILVEKEDNEKAEEAEEVEDMSDDLGRPRFLVRRCVFMVSLL